MKNINLKEDIEEEKQGASHYEKRAKQLPKYKSTFKSMAKDERGHGKRLKAIDKAKK